MSNYTIADDKCLYDVMDVIPVKMLSGITGSTAWAQVFSECVEGINIYTLSSCTTPYYPVTIEETDRKGALVRITYKTDVSMTFTIIALIEFIYDGAIYTREYKQTAAQGDVLTDWVQMVTSEDISALDTRITALENA